MTTIKLKNGSGAPTAGDLVQGEPALDLTNKRLYTENASGTVIEVGTNPTSVTTGNITATGTATFAGLTTTADVSFGDNDKAIFGAGSDLQIYHNGTNSFIADSGTGGLVIRSDSLTVQNAAGTEVSAQFVEDNFVKLFHDNQQRLVTTSTGIDVTGTVTADGLTVDGDATLQGSGGQSFVLSNTDTAIVANDVYGSIEFEGQDASAGSSGVRGSIQGIAESTTGGMGIAFSTAPSGGSNTEAVRIDRSGNVGISTTSPSSFNASGLPLVVGDGIANQGITIYSSPSHYGSIHFADGTGADSYRGYIWYNHANESMGFGTNGTEKMRIDSSGNLLVGDSLSPQTTRFLSKGVGNGSSNYSAYFVNSDETELFGLRNDGVVYTGQDGGSPYNLTTATSANLVVENTGVLRRSTSSRRYKTDIQTATWTGEQIDALRPVTYKGINDGDTVFAGLIAEEVHDAGLTEFVLYNESNEPDAIHYQQMVALCIKEIQSLRARVAQLEGAN